MNMKGETMSDETPTPPKKKKIVLRIKNMLANIALASSATFAIGMIVYVLFFLN